MIFAKLLILFLYSNLFEYAFHRWLLHGWLWKDHGQHHAFPEDPNAWTFFARNLHGLAYASLIVGGNALAWSFWGWLPLAFFAFYYFVLLETAHYVSHRFHCSKHHMLHHADLWEGNFNVWIPLGDLIFRTRIK